MSRGDDLAQAIRRLIDYPYQAGDLSPADRGFIAGGLGVALRSRALIEEAPVFDWLCWPSADNAVYGWGDPYSVNLPLGTVQTSFSDTAHIAREISGATTVVHGVNKIAGLRDWRNADSPLVVSWDTGAIYSGGYQVHSGAGLGAACVRDPAGNSHLLWLETNPSPARVWSQPCVVDGDVVTGLSGVATYCIVDGLTTAPYWAEFSQDATKLIICTGSRPSENSSSEVDVPASFVGQTVTPVVVASTGGANLNYSNNNNYDGSRKCFVKSQYVANELRHLWVQIEISEGSNDTEIGFVSFGSLGLTNYDDEGTYLFYQAPGCGEPPARLEGFDEDSGYNHMNSLNGFLVEAKLFIDSDLVWSKTLRKDGTESDWWCVGVPGIGTICNGFGDIGSEGFPANGSEEQWLNYDGGPALTTESNGLCYPKSNYIDYVSLGVNDVAYACIPQSIIDVRSSNRFCVLDFGDSSDGGATQSLRFSVDLYRDGLQESAVIDGRFGVMPLPTRNTVSSSSSLFNAINAVADSLVINNGLSVSNYGKDAGCVALDLDDGQAVVCGWAVSQDDSERYYIDLLEGADIDKLLSIDEQTNPRIVVRSAGRYMGLIKQR